MVTSDIGPSDLASMRDAGANEIAVKPCSVNQLVQRIDAVALRPRDFVDSEKFTGPSRRRNKKEYLGVRNDGRNSFPIYPTNVFFRG